MQIKKSESVDLIHDMEEYVKYFEGVHKRTMQYVKIIPEELLDWKPSEDKFSIGDLLRHFASARLMFLGIFDMVRGRMRNMILMPS